MSHIIIHLPNIVLVLAAVGIDVEFLSSRVGEGSSAYVEEFVCISCVHDNEKHQMDVA